MIHRPLSTTDQQIARIKTLADITMLCEDMRHYH
jgi:hypothetical protein